MASSSSSGKKPKPYGADLFDIVFSWTLKDIFNEELYKNQVEKIPESFQSVEHYLSSYNYPLLEETRAEFCASMEVISDAPCSEIISLEDAKPHGTSVYDFKVDSWRNRSAAVGKEPYRPRLNDVFLVCDVVPEQVSDLERFGSTWVFGVITKVSEDENITDSKPSGDGDMPMHFKVKTSMAIEVKTGMRNSLFAVFLVNMNTSYRIWSALHMFGNLNIIKEVLCSNSVDKERCSFCYGQAYDVWAKYGANLSSALNESQTDAVLGAISTMQCTHKSSVELIWGPPGTGKTKTVSMLLHTILKLNRRTLTCAPTNIAVAEVAARVLKLVKQPFGIGSGEELPFCSLGDLLLFGNKDKLNVFADLEDIYLDYRVDRLVECFAPLSGWKCCFTSMMEFLKNCLSNYDSSLENELNTQHGSGTVNGTGRERDVHVSFLEYTRNRFKATAPQLKRCIGILCTHLPRRLILQCNFQSMVLLYNLVKSFGSLLFQNDIPEAELKAVFACPEVQGNTVTSVEISGSDVFNSSISSMLYNLRTECIDVLNSLRHSLEDLNLPRFMNKGLVREFCFQSASLIFCTASSSYKLHRVVMEPLQLLVIDEAAQLKECESTIPLQLTGIEHAVLIGDECQLPAMVNSKISDEAGFGRSLFERLSLLGNSKHLLNMQYRMHPKISAFPNAKFYLNQILDAPTVLGKSHERHYLPGNMFGPYSFINIYGGKEELDDAGRSKKNMVEVAVALKIVRNLFKAWNGSDDKLSIGVISPYAAQVAAIQEKLGQKYENFEKFAVRVKSVDGFQGGEEDIIIISTVRSNTGGAIGFLSNPQRANVALTRAKHCLWILGSATTLCNSESCWATLVRDAKARCCFYNADEDKDLAKAILQVKKEHDQLDELLNGNSILLKNAIWKVLFSDNFRKSFGQLKSSQIKKAVINLLVKLSNGWRPKKRNVDSVCESSLQLVKQFKVSGLYLISTVDIVKHSTYIQVLKIWDILPLEEIPKLVKRLDNIFGMYTDDFVSRCNIKRIEGNVEVPVNWKLSDDIIRYKDMSRTELTSNSSSDAFDGRSYVENSKVTESLLLLKFYSLSSGIVNHLLSGRDGRELDLPFEVTDQELDMILFPRSTFILGRSGTGKTTVLTMKLFQKEQHRYFASEGLQLNSDSSRDAENKNWTRQETEEFGKPVLRQMFVTVSPKLCSAVKKHISNLKSFSCGEKPSEQASADMHDIDDIVEFGDLVDHFSNIPQDSYPLVITFQKFLTMLDGSIGTSFFDRFSVISDFSLGTTRYSRSFALQAFVKRKEVDYDRFSSLYWPHFNCQLTKKVDCSAVFTEIISHIKGGLIAGKVPEGKLSREDYIVLSEGRVSSLNQKTRETIYDIFLDYEKKKMQKGEFDQADLVIDLHGRLRDGSYDGNNVDFVYIDEVQDLTMREIALFKYVCRNVTEGFVFSGDTAQTIARGIDFRFQDIRSLFYNEFLLQSESDDKDKARDKDECRVSKIFNLSQNFRTHAGVLKLAQSVIDLIYSFFPHSIDLLSPETSLIYGEAPVLLESGSDENAIITIFGNSGNGAQSVVGFGAEQVILVRDDGAKKEILDQVGKQALVLTIIECKGLEFQDVLLYNFFGTSPLRHQWRVVYGYMNERNLLDSTGTKFPSFSKAKHNILCSELKQLYVAITRTRQRLWICENKEDFSKPMFDYWKKLGFVQVRQLDESLAHAMQKASTKEEWSSRGIKLFNEGNFEMAIMCFERAGDLYKEKWARAASLRASADRMGGSNSESARVPLLQAAEIYETIGKAESAAKCYIDLKDYKRAGELYLEKCGESRLGDAGDCFSLAGCWEVAAEIYSRGNYFLKCLSACTNGNLFDNGLHFIEYWKTNTDLNANAVITEEFKNMEQSFLEKCAIHYHKLKDTNRMMKFVRAFVSMNSIRNFLKSWDYIDELVLLEGESGNFVEAASLARLIGDLLLEADMLEKAGNYGNASRVILRYVLSNSLWATGSKGWPLKQFPNKEKLLTKAKLLAENKSAILSEFISMEAYLLSSQESNLSELGKWLTAAENLKNLGAEIICERKILDAILRISAAKYEWENNIVLNSMKHAEDMISQNHASLETLIYFWNLWRDKILNILNYLCSFGRKHEKDFENYEEFCLAYLGVCKQEHNQRYIYLVLHNNAYWMREIDDTVLQKNRGMVCMEAQQFVFAARSYFTSEVRSVGLRVLETLEGLHKFSSRSSKSIFCQGTAILGIFEVTRSLLESGIVDKKQPWALKNFSALCRKQFLETVCPMNWNQTMTESMINLRGTQVYQDLMKEVIIENIGSKNSLTHGEVGRAMMMIFVSGSLSDEVYQMFSKRFEVNSPWEVFIRHLKEYMHSGLVQLPLIRSYQEALEDTFNANWRRVHDYISPRCYVYLLECLVFLVSSCHGFFFTTQSSLVESLSCESWIRSSSATANPDLRGAVNSIAMTITRNIQQILACRKETLEWLDKTDSTAKQDYHILVLRLVILIGTICLNYGQAPFMVYNLLNRKDISSLLPKTFVDILRGRRKHPFPNVLAEALRQIGNPLVVVRKRNDRSQFACTNAVIVDMALIHCKEDILGVLFPQKPESPRVDSITEFENEKPGNSNLPSDQVNKDECLPDLAVPDKGDSLMEIENEWDNLRMSYKRFWNTFDAVKGKIKNSKVFVSKALQAKLDVEQCTHVLAAAIGKLSQSDGDKSLSGDAEAMLSELKQLSNALSVSSVQLETNISTVRALFTKLRGRKPMLQQLLDSLFSQDEKKIDVANSSAQANAPSVVQNNSNSSTTNNTDISGNKGKENPKSKKGKKKNKSKKK